MLLKIVCPLPPVLAFVCAGLLVAQTQGAQDARPAPVVQPAPPAHPLLHSLSRLPLRFEANLGQTASAARFVARGPGYAFFLTPTEAVLSFRDPLSRATAPLRGRARRTGPRAGDHVAHFLRLELVGANPQPQLSGSDPLSGTVSYLRGSDARGWRVGVPSYARVQYREAYPGIDLIYYGNQGELEYDFQLQPGADPSSIALRFSGAEQLRVEAGGTLTVQLAGGDLRWKKPVAFQVISGARREVPCEYVVSGLEIGFRLGRYDPTQPLTIDPVLVYSTYLGGSLQDIGQSIAVDRLGNVFVTGQADSLNFPTNRAVRGTNSGSADVFVTKLNSNGSALIYSTYVGGRGADVGYGIAVDDAGQAYVTGTTDSGNFPTVNAVQSSLASSNSCDAFVFKLGTNGTNLAYSSYLGGPGFDAANAIAVDPTQPNLCFVVGYTLSTNQFHTKNPFQINPGKEGDAFIARFNTGGSGNASLDYSSWLGGDDDEEARAVCVDAAGSTYLAGEIRSDCTSCPKNFPLVNAYQTAFGGGDTEGFVARVNPAGTSLLFSSYLGGTRDDSCAAIALDASGHLQIAGTTSSTNFPLRNAAQTTLGNTNSFNIDAFVARFGSNLATLEYSTFLGGSINDEARGLALDAMGRAFITGMTTSRDFPLSGGPLQTNFGGGIFGSGSDAFVSMLDTRRSGSGSILFSTFFGGSQRDEGLGIAVDVAGNCYLTGKTESTNGIVRAPGAFQGSLAGGIFDCFVAKLVQPPRLAIVPDGAQVALRWPVLPAGFQPEAKAGVTAPAWSGVPGNAAVSDGMNQLRVTNDAPHQTFRLRRP